MQHELASTLITRKKSLKEGKNKGMLFLALDVAANMLGTMDQPEEYSSFPPRRTRRGNVEKVLWRGPGHDNLPISLSEASENVLEDSSGFRLFQ